MSDVAIGQHKGLLSPFVDNWRMKKVARLIPAHTRVLDIGCGPAMLISHLPAGCSYVGIDSDAALIEANRRKYPDHFFRETEATSSVFPFNDDAFDVVVMAAFLEHLSNPRVLLSEVARVLKLSGLAVATTPSSAGGHLHEVLAGLRLLSHEAAEDHEKFWNRQELERVCVGTGLRVDRYRHFQAGLNQLIIFKKEPRP